MTEKRQRLLRGRIIIALHEELGRKPTTAEIERYCRAARVLYATILPAFFERQLLKSKSATPHYSLDEIEVRLPLDSS